MNRRLPALPSPYRGGMNPNEPQPGYWMIRLKRGAPPMPASIRRSHFEPGSVPANLLSTGPTLIANIGWQDADPLAVWTGRRVKVLTRREYEFEMARVSWVRAYAPDEPEAQPEKAVDLSMMKPIGPGAA